MRYMSTQLASTRHPQRPKIASGISSYRGGCPYGRNDLGMMKMAFFYIGIVCSILHCKPSNTTSTSAVSPSDKSNALSSSSLNSDVTTDSTTTPLYFDPSRAAVSIQKEVKQTPTILFDGIVVPTISLSLQQADYVQILRCSASFEFKTQGGKLVENVSQSPSNQGELKWAWITAWNQKDSCEIVTEMSPSVTYPDIAAPTGRFYYILNPCISKIHSTENRDACSYLTQVTSVFSYTNVFQAEMRQKAIDLSNVESSLRAFMAQVQIISGTLSTAIIDCENYWAQHDTLQNLRSGLAELGIFIGFAIILAPFSGFAALFTANMAAMIGNMFMEQFKAFEKKGNVCMAPTRTGDNDFGIHDLYDRLQVVLNTSIPNTQKQMETLLDEMNKYDNRVLTYNKGIEKMKLLGVDLSSQASVKAAVDSTIQTGHLPGDSAAAPSGN